jgi:hypothetical protein
LAGDFGISHYAAQQVRDIEKGAPEFLKDVVQGKMAPREAAAIARARIGHRRRGSKEKKSTTEQSAKNATGVVSPETERLIANAVKAIEKILAKIPEDQKKEFRERVASTILNLAA